MTDDEDVLFDQVLGQLDEIGRRLAEVRAWASAMKQGVDDGE